MSVLAINSRRIQEISFTRHQPLHVHTPAPLAATASRPPPGAARSSVASMCQPLAVERGHISADGTE
jgi:hypothetical protein